eukprot:gnl/TRDRNA2_/TRDRNA2_63517_c0_seq1.p1 gnl/TRDRNA2_/TRDRNA2_63517_c0~~gnl/TRDRNA2_/TRDRNA2_63517_c0_seq1.p1  ORF type:complete len:315 (+),score=59.18 gnl/TRDRNA2_/TRDRNA2_63517_c0_seq1:57-1001(+)
MTEHEALHVVKHCRIASTGSASTSASIGFGEDYEYPAPLCVKNTFIDGPCAGLGSSLEGFFREREVKSCPSSRLLGCDTEDSEAVIDSSKDAASSSSGSKATCSEIEKPPAAPAETQVSGSTVAHVVAATPYLADSWCIQNTFLHFPVGDEAESLEGFFQEREVKSCPASHLQPRACCPPLEGIFQELESSCQEPDVQASKEMPSFASAAPRILLLDEALCSNDGPYGEDLCSNDDGERVPSVGSMGHAIGRCKPCAFVHTTGCASGASCVFCHLCEPGEKKRRRKDKLASRREVARKRREAVTLQAGAAGKHM